MDKFRTTDLGGLPFVLDDIRQFLGRLTAPANHGIYQAFNNILGGFGTDFIIQGCVLSGSTGAFSITEGWILLSGELIKVDAQGPFDEVANGTFTKVTTFDSRGNKNFLNGSVADTYEKNRGVISGLAGTLDFDGDTFSELRSIAEFGSGTVIIKRKVIEIGDWNMDTLTTTSVTHGLSDESKIRSVNVMIQNDDEDTFFPLSSTQDGTLLIEGAVRDISGGTVSLTRRSTGRFDSTDFNAVSPALATRGWVTIEFEK